MTLAAQHKFTLYGVIAILLWSTLTALIREISELFSPIGGAALIYSVSSICLIAVMGLPKFKQFSARYLLLGGLLFVSYEVFFSLALGLAKDRQQSVEIAIINYLWPALTIFFAVLLSKKKIHVLVFPSILLAFIGVAWCISGDQGFSIHQIIINITHNPIAYSLAFLGAIIWAIYCNLAKGMGETSNPIPLFFIATAISLWIQFAISNEPALTFTFSSSFKLLIVAIVMGAGYALWNNAIIGGNMILLGTFSYFTPIFASIFSAFYLNIQLSGHFWQGVGLVTFASLVCFMVTREKSSQQNSKIEIQ